jgi:hypothetical protein
MEKMNTATMITNMFVEEGMRQIKQGKTPSQAADIAEKKVKDAGWYIIDGKWKNIKKQKTVTPSQKKAFSNRSDEKGKLAKVLKTNLSRMA